MKEKKKGFTLIEFIIVIGILGILIIAAIPKISSYSYIKLVGATNKLASDIRYAQQLAISKQLRCGLYIYYPKQNKYFIYELVDPNKPFDPNDEYKIAAIDPHTRGKLIVDFTNHTSYQGIEIFNSNLNNNKKVYKLEFDQWGVPYTGNGKLIQSDGFIALAYKKKLKIIYITPNTGNLWIE